MEKCRNDVLQFSGGLSSLLSAWHYIIFPWHWIIRLIGWSPPSPHLTIMHLNTRATTSTCKEFSLHDYQQLSAARHYFPSRNLAKGPAPDYFMGNARIRFLFTIWVVSENSLVRFADWTNDFLRGDFDFRAPDWLRAESVRILITMIFVDKSQYLWNKPGFATEFRTRQGLKGVGVGAYIKK